MRWMLVVGLVISMSACKSAVPRNPETTLGLIEGQTWVYHMIEEPGDHEPEPGSHEAETGHDHSGEFVTEDARIQHMTVGKPIVDGGDTWYPVSAFPAILRFCPCEIAEDKDRVRIRNITGHWGGSPKAFDLVRFPLALGKKWPFPIRDMDAYFIVESNERVHLPVGELDAWKIALRVDGVEQAFDYFWFAEGWGVVQIGGGSGTGHGNEYFHLEELE
jgi:hypothetical protein